jgi:EpsI family protein
MDREQRWLIVLMVALLVAAAISWRLYLRPDLAVDFAQLDALPHQLDDWRGYDIPVEDGVAKMLAADYNLQRVYITRAEDLVWLYVGYYGTLRGGRPEHTPWVCYPSNGWEILQQGIVPVDSRDGRRANEILVEQDGKRRLVHFWYRSHRRSGMLGAFEQALDRLLGRLVEGRADGALVRLSTPLEAGIDIAMARTRLVSFGRTVEPIITARWPSETGSAQE